MVYCASEEEWEGEEVLPYIKVAKRIQLYFLHFQLLKLNFVSRNIIQQS